MPWFEPRLESVGAVNFRRQSGDQQVRHGRGRLISYGNLCYGNLAKFAATGRVAEPADQFGAPAGPVGRFSTTSPGGTKTWAGRNNDQRQGGIRLGGGACPGRRRSALGIVRRSERTGEMVPPAQMVLRRSRGRPVPAGRVPVRSRSRSQPRSRRRRRSCWRHSATSPRWRASPSRRGSTTKSSASTSPTAPSSRRAICWSRWIRECCRHRSPRPRPPLRAIRPSWKWRSGICAATPNWSAKGRRRSSTSTMRRPRATRCGPPSGPIMRRWRTSRSS